MGDIVRAGMTPRWNAELCCQTLYEWNREIIDKASASNNLSECSRWNWRVRASDQKVTQLLQRCHRIARVQSVCAAAARPLLVAVLALRRKPDERHCAGPSPNNYLMK